MPETDHGVVDGAPSVPPPLAPTAPAPRLSTAEEARSLVAATNVAALATLTAGGDPWASMVTFGVLRDGARCSASRTWPSTAATWPATPARASVIAQVDDDHADALLVIARALGGYPDATAARCSGLDRRGIDLAADTPRGPAPVRVAFARPLSAGASCAPRRSS